MPSFSAASSISVSNTNTPDAIAVELKIGHVVLHARRTQRIGGVASAARVCAEPGHRVGLQRRNRAIFLETNFHRLENLEMVARFEEHIGAGEFIAHRSASLARQERDERNVRVRRAAFIAKTAAGKFGDDAHLASRQSERR
jgi:hypothetical protein